MQVEPAVVKIDFEVTVDSKTVKVHDINSFGAKAFFFLSFDDEPAVNLDSEEVKSGSDIGEVEKNFNVPGEYTVTGNI